jgi:hypothetical protein
MRIIHLTFAVFFVLVLIIMILFDYLIDWIKSLIDRITI